MSTPAMLALPQAATTPYPHSYVTPVLDEEQCAHLLTWLRQSAPWQYHQSTFYRQLECDLRRAPLPAELKPLFDEESITALRHAMEQAFGVRLDQHVSIIAHKLLPGYGIGIHNDAPDPGMETHRFVLQLNPRDAPLVGGEMVLYHSNAETDVFTAFSPAYNSGFAFEMSDHSFHAVRPIEVGERYSVVYSFWTQASAEVKRRSAQTDDNDTLAVLAHVLASLGATTIEHSERTLLDHLVGTYALLQDWECSSALCLAGLFHSVYGTESFRQALIAQTERDLVCQLITPRAEELVYLFGTTARHTLYEVLLRGDAPRLRQFDTGTYIDVAPEVLRDLLTLDAANYVEEARRVPMPTDEEDVSASTYRALAELLPHGARQELAALGIV